MTRCIHCTRCIRYLNEIIDISFLGVISRGFSMKITNFMNNLYNAFALGNVIDICPVAAITTKNYIEPRGALTAHNTEDRSRA
jgi:NADH-quinone oxidoreductase subunit G